MNSRLTISFIVAIAGLSVGFFLLYDIQQDRENAKITPEKLDKLLQESNQRLKIIKDDFYNGKYNGDVPIEETITIIESEIQVQKDLLTEYKKLPQELKTDKTIDMRFWQLGKYSWAGENSMLKALQNQLP
ncbi:MAG: hypothetical protein R3327_05285 [Nitrosopumilaceae archaeon]|nr:hypothetical protein [Nitrosopumilaceae archaeon]